VTVTQWKLESEGHRRLTDEGGIAEEYNAIHMLQARALPGARIVPVNWKHFGGQFSQNMYVYPGTNDVYMYLSLPMKA